MDKKSQVKEVEGTKITEVVQSIGIILESLQEIISRGYRGDKAHFDCIESCFRVLGGVVDGI